MFSGARILTDPHDPRVATRHRDAGVAMHIAEKTAKENIMPAMASSRHAAGLSGLTPDIRVVIDSTPALIHTGLPDGHLDFFNQTWLQYVGCTLEDLLGWKWTDWIHPEDVTMIVEKWRASLASGAAFLHEARVRRADGEYRWMLHHKIPLRDEQGKILKWFGSSVDIEDRKRAEEKLRRDEQELRQIVDAIPHAINVLEPDGSMLYSNQAVLDYSGLTMEEVMAPDFRTRVFHPDDLASTAQQRQQALSRGLPFEQEQRGLRKDGQYRWLIFRYVPLRDEQGRIIRWYATGTDIDDRKQTEERMRNENLALREEIDRSSMFEEIVGTSPALYAVLSRVSKVAPTDSTVLITGETGTGKELVARAIHRRSQRSSRSFVSVNCAAIPRDLLASELFGHEKGAFTGALQRRVGRFELAEGGTIFLDEVGELPTETQIALLRVLQEREFDRVGGIHPIRADVRVIAATRSSMTWNPPLPQVLFGGTSSTASTFSPSRSRRCASGRTTSRCWWSISSIATQGRPEKR